VERRPSFLSSRTYTRPTNRSQPSETTRVTAEIFKEAAFSDPEILSDAAVVLERVDEHFFEESRKLDEDLDRVLAQHHLREPVQAIVRALIDDSPDQVGATDTVGSGFDANQRQTLDERAHNIAERIVAAGLAERCEVELTYARDSRLALVAVHTFSTELIPIPRIEQFAREWLTPDA
jgi:hypothetical protein